jgi:hypothetical protein
VAVISSNQGPELKHRLRRTEKGSMRSGAARTMNLLASLCAFAAIAAAAAAISGCGASATLDPVARAAELTSRQAGSHFTMTMQLSSPMLPGGVSLSASGYVDERRRAGEMNMNLAGIPGISQSAQGAGSIHMIFQFPVLYMNMPVLAGRLPAGKTWIKLDLAKLASKAGVDASQLGSLNQADPTQFLSYLRASSGAVTTVGSEQIGGTPTTHYRATLQLDRILDRLPDSQRAAARGMLEHLGTGSIPVDVWVDQQGRLRRMQLSIGGGSTGTNGTSPLASVSGTLTLDLTSYGPVPPIVPPPASQVFDASAVATGSLGQLAGAS